MKTIILSFAAMLIAFTSFSQDEVGGPKITVTEETYDFGTIDYMSDARHDFTIVNDGDSPLIISKAKGSCSCTVPTWPKEPIAPGASASITVKYDTKRPGIINKSVTITSNAANEPVKIIRIKGQVSPNPEDSTPIDTSGPTKQ